MGQHIRDCAQAVATELEKLPYISKIYPFAKPVSLIQDTEGVLVFTSGEIPGFPNDTVPQGGQLVTFQLFVRFLSGTQDVDAGEKLNEKLTDLCSAHPTKSITGILWDNSSLAQYGYPQVVPGGVSVDYDESTDDSIITKVECAIGAIVDIGG